MLFNSLAFLKFLPVVFLLYWFFSKRNVKIQNIILLGASYYFYSCWDTRFLFLLIFSTFLDYFTGIRMSESKSDHSKTVWFWVSITINLGLLGVFKYYDFFVTSFAHVLANVGLNINPWTLNVILPVGISFYTFHGLSYVIDIYKNKIKAERNFIDYSVFVSFFPLLVAGPIERATHLLPQIKQKRVFDYVKAVDGLRQILWGLIKKVVIADQCAEYANLIFNNSGDYSGATLVLGAVFFTFQIYGDFSGYSDIALGTARLFGIELLKNFSFPYFSRDIAEFWRRWHISLSTWFKDYLYIPLGGSKVGIWKKIRNTLIIFLVSGLWHGANWTFIIWGLLNALYIMPSIIFNANRNNIDIVAKGKRFPSLKEFVSILLTFSLTAFAWIFFRSKNIDQAFGYVGNLLTGILHKNSYIETINLLYWDIGYCLPIMLFCFLIVEWMGRENDYGLAKIGLNWNRYLRWGMYLLFMVLIFYFSGSDEKFIYFQF